MQELEELLVFGGRRRLELGVEAPHILFGQTRSAHDGNKLFFGDHLYPFKSFLVIEQFQDGPLLPAQALDFGVEFLQATL
jgi:hypothetical protein